MNSKFLPYYKMKLIVFILCIGQLNALNFCGEPVLQIGWFSAKQGKSQHINMEGLIGDDFSVKKSSDQNLLVGIGYYFDWQNASRVKLKYGLNAFYLAPTRVNGLVTQEDLFTNLSYHYSRTNYPIYFALKALYPWCDCYDITLDVGIGPNIVSAGDFKERSLDGGVTLPDTHIFSRKNTVSFSATAGLGFRINNILGDLSLEIDYRFFYLGEGKLKKASSQLKNTLRTGHSYANAIFITVSL